MKRRLCAAETARLPGHPRPFLRPRADPRGRPRSPRGCGPGVRPQVSTQTAWCRLCLSQSCSSSARSADGRNELRKVLAEAAGSPRFLHTSLPG